jgi:hypothetical protein
MPQTGKTSEKATAKKPTCQKIEHLTPHLLARAPREQGRWGVRAPPPGLT